ncbi:hypothetical protein [Bradyrhizobium liaoningense]|uniref:hypothetical protein n=1 Tax=Bradyrhizobium liaoningense TaxID=43992 RepID=UPI001BA5D70A|nr:hypothetical protein [Bradyrhizobium liaoningense]MBR0714049.1 hypothetical protein [Bradyrhizobium liaoningense]
MAGIMKRAWFSAAERDRRIVSSVLGDKQLALMDKANAEVDALLRRRRAKAKANALLRRVRANAKAKAKAKALLRRLRGRTARAKANALLRRLPGS